MTPKEEAKELVHRFLLNKTHSLDNIDEAKQCALICVGKIINSNPHYNPLNTNVYSTMSYWQEVKLEINKL